MVPPEARSAEDVGVGNGHERLLGPNKDRPLVGPFGLDFGAKFKIFVTRGNAC